MSEGKRHHGESPEVMFELRHEPGLMGLSDFTKLKGVSITIDGEPYPHLIYHYRLAYSGWQYAQIIEGGESFIALSKGWQNAFEASILDLNAYARGYRYAAEIINLLPQKPKPGFWAQVLNRLTNLGRIHPAPSFPNSA